MPFIDHVTISVKGGHGGPGASSFRREKYVAKGGPDGGDGGSGGHVIFEGSLQLQSLLDLKIKKKYIAKSGQKGAGKQMSGLDGEDIVIPVPFGTIVFDEDGNQLWDITEDTPRFVAAKGGKGGKGNMNFATSRNQAPKYAQPGLAGDEKTLQLELRMIAEVGFVGMPNAGKSTLLKTLTNANPKIANYPFTTLYPNLGTLRFYDREIILADIPGIISGASEGVGLGYDFLRHIDRTKILLHLVELTPSAEETYNHYQVIEAELKESEYPLIEKERIVVLNKTDVVPKECLEETVALFEEHNITPLSICAVSHDNIETLINALYEKTSS